LYGFFFYRIEEGNGTEVETDGKKVKKVKKSARDNSKQEKKVRLIYGFLIRGFSRG